MEPAPGITPFPPGRVFRFGLPLVLGMGGHALFNLVDLWIVGPLGPAALAAVTVASLVNTIAMVVMQGVTDGSVAVIARAAGAGDAARTLAAARSSLLLVAVLALALGVPPWLFAEALARALGAGGEALAPTTDCLRVMSLGSGTMFLLMQVTGILRALGRARSPAALLLSSNLLNAVLAYGLVHGAWGLPRLGVVGAPWGTVITRGAVGLAGLLLLARPPLRLRLRDGGFAWGFAGSLLRLGLPAAGVWLVRLSVVLLVLRLLEPGGAAAQAAYGVGGRLDTLALFATVGWGAAAATAVGQGLGARDPAGAVRAAWCAVLLGVLTMGLAGALFAAFAPGVVGLVANLDGGGAAGEVPRLGVLYLRTIVLAYPAMALSVVLSLAMAGAGSFVAPLVLEGAVLVAAQVPLLLASAPAGAGADPAPLWRAVVASQWLLAGLYLALFLRGGWKRQVV